MSLDDSVVIHILLFEYNIGFKAFIGIGYVTNPVYVTNVKIPAIWHRHIWVCSKEEYLGRVQI